MNDSTDKAADATSALLAKTKRAGEELTAWFAFEGAGTYLPVRFGNVLGSRASMLHTFTSRVCEQGGARQLTRLRWGGRVRFFGSPD